MQDIKIVPHIVIDGQDCLADHIPEEIQREIYEKLARRFMQTLGAVPDKEEVRP